MAEMQSYDQRDIKRYLQHQMSREEMHAFEKAMMEDPFLADALEGYQQSNMNKAEEHLIEIERTLKAEERAKVVPMLASPKNWLRIAAMFIVIAGAGVFGYKLLNKPGENDNSFAANRSAKVPSVVDSIKTADKAAPPLASPNIFSEKQIASNQKSSGSPIIKSNTGTGGANTLSNKLLSEGSGAMAMKDDSKAEAATSKALSAAAPVKDVVTNESAKQMKVPAANQEIRGRVIDSKGSPVENATITANNTAATTADKNGNFSIKGRDTATDVTVAAVGHAPVTRRINSNEATNQIVLPPTNDDLQEVVITGYSKRKNATDKRSSSSVEPEGGWSNFHRYIDSSLTKAKLKDPSYMNGDVELEFLVDPQGRPVDIKTINTTGKELESRAIGLIEKGPKWMAKRKNAKAKVIIRF